MFKELETVALSHDIPGHGLEGGDIGAIVHVHSKDSFEVEFVTAQGETVAVLSLSPRDIRPIEKREILHVRELEYAVA